MGQPFLSVVVPAYNEFLRIGQSLEKIRRYLESKDFASELIVMDDGSTDRTPELLREIEASFPAGRVLRNEPQRGTGFGFDPEVLFLIERLGGKIVEVPVRWNDDPATKVRLLQDSAAMALDLVRLRWRAWTGQYSGPGAGG